MNAPHESAPAKTENSNSGAVIDEAATKSAGHDPSRVRLLRTGMRYLLPPLLVFGAGVLLIVSLGLAQRVGWIRQATVAGRTNDVTAKATAARYICPMMCTPPQSEPGRCPVCAMELEPASPGGSMGGEMSIAIDPAARRVANIRTAAVESAPLNRTIRAIGELSYDEGSMRTIAAYVDGRLERLYADYTGVAVAQGDHLALVYSPDLYSSQVEFLLARDAWRNSLASRSENAQRSSKDVYDSAKRRLIELGMTQAQIGDLEEAGESNSRMHLCAPISGTVIEKLAVEGQYVKEGQPIYRLADLSTVWMMLELFPEDAAAIRYGQRVHAEVPSLPGHSFAGTVAFIDPGVRPSSRTVGVRVVVNNREGKLRIGDYAKATIEVPIMTAADGRVHDPELADKWVSPRHPHIVRAAPGKCPICGIDLVPAAELGITGNSVEVARCLVVPRNAVLTVGNDSVVYVETEPGHFEIRRVTLGAHSEDRVVVLAGLSEGELVATQGNFLIDSQMQLAGNPSLIDPGKLDATRNQLDAEGWAEALASLSDADREQAIDQRICPVTQMQLGSMGPPPKLQVGELQVFICCEGCREALLEDPERYLANLATGQTPDPFDGGDDWELPPIGTPQMMTPSDDMPAEYGPSVEEHGTTQPTGAGRALNARVTDRKGGELR